MHQLSNKRKYHMICFLRILEPWITTTEGNANATKDHLLNRWVCVSSWRNNQSSVGRTKKGDVVFLQSSLKKRKRLATGKEISLFLQTLTSGVNFAINRTKHQAEWMNEVRQYGRSHYLSLDCDWVIWVLLQILVRKHLAINKSVFPSATGLIYKVENPSDFDPPHKHHALHECTSCVPFVFILIPWAPQSSEYTVFCLFFWWYSVLIYL